VERGQGKPSPYETRKLFAKKTRIYGTAIPGSAPAGQQTPHAKSKENKALSPSSTGKRRKKMLDINVGSRNVIENKGNYDILSCSLSDILGNSEPI
jgi:hypothetical protein